MADAAGGIRKALPAAPAVGGLADRGDGLRPAPRLRDERRARERGQRARRRAPWKCSDKQRDLILRLVEEHNLDKGEVEGLSRERFGKGVKLLSKLEASGLIDELIERHGGNGGRPNGSRRARRNAYAGRSQ
ncbi:MAG: hypothetical protein M5U12_17530 [Verrucomicrobia bacterium]|nr:hypothetical protein [Verrucomicrobiota bacterium]